MHGLDVVVKDIARGEFEVLGVPGGDVECRDGMDKVFEDLEKNSRHAFKRSREGNQTLN